MKHSKAHILQSLERAVERANIQTIPEGSFTTEQFREKTGMSVDQARRFFKREVAEGRLAFVSARQGHSKLHFYYEPKNEQ